MLSETFVHLACFLYLITVLSEYDVFGQEDADDNASSISMPMFDLRGGGGLAMVAGRPVIPTSPVDGGSTTARDRPSGSRASTAEQSSGDCELPGMILDKFERIVYCSIFVCGSNRTKYLYLVLCTGNNCARGKCWCRCSGCQRGCTGFVRQRQVDSNSWTRRLQGDSA